MLLIYTFVFSLVFQSRWQSEGVDIPPQQFALILFAGLTPFNVFSEVTNRAPSLITSVPNYVKKVLFPLEILPVVNVGVALVNSFISIVLLLIGYLIIFRTISATIYLLPIVYIPLIFLSLGIGWFLSALGTYIRDIANGIGIFVQMMFFLSPIFYSASSVPGSLQRIYNLNPLVTIIDCFRQVLFWGEPISWYAWGIWTVITLLFAWSGHWCFQILKKGFADVI